MEQRELLYMLSLSEREHSPNKSVLLYKKGRILYYATLQTQLAQPQKALAKKPTLERVTHKFPIRDADRVKPPP